jgi:predicted ATPase/class 3 adenylate cyclase
MNVSYDSGIETFAFLFTDIEGSTALLRRLGDEVYASVLADHQRLIRAALDAYDGMEQDTQGDAFFAAFASTRACVSAALEMQRELRDYEWPSDENLRVRMGIHTGEAVRTATRIVGFEVHRAARIAAVGHGGQVLLSSTSASLVGDALPDGVSLRDLGSHRLKDLGGPEIIFQLVTEDLDSDFAPLRSLDNPELANNLPTSLNTFVGRSAELSEVGALIESSRLVTLTGTGGAGKTRLALQAAAELLDGSGEGVWFVDLAPVSDPDQVPSTVMNVLQLRLEPETAPLDSLVRSLRDQNVLLVLDNCEHVIDAVANMVDLIGRHCPRVSILATSREALGVDGERVYRVRSLSLPETDVTVAGDLEGSDAVALFLDRARSHDAVLEIDDTVAALVASVCRQLDGIPLAIELAASRLSSMSLDDLHDRLDQRFRLLTGGSRGALPRQQTLAATVAWSYDLLHDPERDLLRRLSVFAGGFDLKAAEDVCVTDELRSFEVADLLSSLVNKSLVSAERASSSLRYRLLETIRRYAADALLEVGGESETFRLRQLHAEHFLALCREAAPELEGPTQGAWLRRLDLEYDNLLATFTTLLADPVRNEDVVRIATSLYRFVFTRRNTIIPGHLRDALARDGDLDLGLRARAVFVLAWMTAENGQEERSKRRASDLSEEALALAQELGDAHFHAEALTLRSFTLTELGEPVLALDYASTALELARELDDPRRVGEALMSFVYATRRPSEAIDEIRESLAIFRQLGDHASTATMLLFLSIAQDDSLEGVREARALNAEAMELAEEIGSTYHRLLLWSNAGGFDYFLGDYDQALVHSRRAINLARRSGLSIELEHWSIFTLSCVATLQGDYLLGAQLAGAHDGIEERASEPLMGLWSQAETKARDNNRDLLREALGSDEYERAIVAGKNLNANRIYDLAMGRSEPLR